MAVDSALLTAQPDQTIDPQEGSDRTAPSAHSALLDPLSLSPRLRVRRAVYLVVLTLLLPGSAQLGAAAPGALSRRVGAVAVRIWLALLGVVVVLAATWWLDRTVVLGLVTSPLVLAAVSVGCLVGAVCWPALVVDAWRLGRPSVLARRARLAMTGVLVAAVLATSLPLLAIGRRTWAAADLINGVFGASRTSDPVAGRFNVLLLGGDAGPDRVGTRPDSMTLASIDSTTGRTVLFSLPRNIENVPFAPGSPAAQAMPAGWACGDKCLLNGIYTWGAEHAQVFPGARDSGAEAMKEAVAGITGLTVNYYVLIDLQGFRRLIDAMGGVELTVTQRVPIGGGTSRVSGYIEPGTQHLDGYHALWFARSRHGASDYARMERQRCVMNAMVHQMDPTTLLARFQDIAAASKQVMSTDIPAGQLAGFIDLGTKAKSQPISSVQFVPPLVDPAYPDYTAIHARVVQAIASSKATSPSKAAAAQAAPSVHAVPSSKAAQSPVTSSAVPAGAVPSTDLASACSVA